MEEFEGRGREMLTTGEWCKPVSNMNVAPCVKEVEWAWSTRGLRIMAAFWIGIPVEVTQEPA